MTCLTSVFIIGCLSAAFPAFYLHAKKMVFWWLGSMKMMWKPAKRKAGTSVLLNQTERAKLNHCTPLDRVMFNVCAVALKVSLSWWNWLKCCYVRAVSAGNLWPGLLLYVLWDFGKGDVHHTSCRKVAPGFTFSLHKWPLKVFSFRPKVYLKALGLPVAVSLILNGIKIRMQTNFKRHCCSCRTSTNYTR